VEVTFERLPLELEQIQFLLGHVSVETTERYLGCKQRLRDAVNDKIRLEL
jgi:site-specific recombinase XerD